MRIRKANGREARGQAVWIVAMEPWRAMGYQAPGLGRWLARCARSYDVLLAEERGAVIGIVVCQPDFLLGSFISLLAVRAQAAGRGVGRKLMERIEGQVFAHRRWLYVSSDSQNQPAARFYRKLGFSRVARLPGLLDDGHVEILWRKRRPA